MNTEIEDALNSLRIQIEARGWYISPEDLERERAIERAKASRRLALEGKTAAKRTLEDEPEGDHGEHGAGHRSRSSAWMDLMG